MHKSPKEIARSLRAFQNAHRLNLLRCIRIAPGDGACDAARSQVGLDISAVSCRVCRSLNAPVPTANAIMYPSGVKGWIGLT